jgi:hypothetical protein
MATMDPALRPHYQGSVRRLSLLLPLLFASSSPSLLLSLQTSPNLLLTSLLPQVWHEWVVDPYAKGTWAMYPPNFYNHYYHELQKPYGNVEWASSDFALSGWKGALLSFFQLSSLEEADFFLSVATGFIDGAVAEGTRSADLLVKEFRARKKSKSSRL